MGRGQAHGIYLEYQTLARDILRVSRYRGFQPYSGEGIDVPIKAAASTWRIDIALKSPDGHNIILVECKRYNRTKLKQEHVAAFGGIVELLRRYLKESVSGVFFTIAKPQPGALEAAADLGITFGLLQPEHRVSGFCVQYHEYDPSVKRRSGRSVWIGDAHVTDEGHGIDNFAVQATCACGGACQNRDDGQRICTVCAASAGTWR